VRTSTVGLGAGTLASYARPGKRWTFFEIDPVVVRIAGDAERFTYLRDARRRLLESGGTIDVVLGDARLRLRRSDGRFGLIIIDAVEADRGRHHRPQPRPPMRCLVEEDTDLAARDRAEGKSPSIWAVLSEDRALLRAGRERPSGPTISPMPSR